MRSKIFTKFEIPAGAPIPEADQGLGPAHELLDFVPTPLRPSDVVGRRVDQITAHAGTYGMGGPGFFGFRLDREWLIIAIWGAGEWLQVNGRRVEDSFNEIYGNPKPWISGEGDELSALLVGCVIASIEIEKTSMRMTFGNGAILTIEKDSRARPIFRGSGERREFAPDDDLRTGIFLCPTAEIWV